MQLETLEEIRERMNELRKDIEKEVGETDKPLHAEAAMQEFPGDTRSTTALYRKLNRAEKLLADEKLSEASEVLRQEDQAHITEEGLEELKELAGKIDEEREKIAG